MKKDELIETALSECGLNDRFHLSISDMERTIWRVLGKSLFGDIIIACVDGEYSDRTYPASRKVFRRKRLVEMY